MLWWCSNKIGFRYQAQDSRGTGTVCHEPDVNSCRVARSVAAWIISFTNIESKWFDRMFWRSRYKIGYRYQAQDSRGTGTE